MALLHGTTRHPSRHSAPMPFQRTAAALIFLLLTLAASRSAAQPHQRRASRALQRVGSNSRDFTRIIPQAGKVSTK